jgi:hypothetical protein
MQSSYERNFSKAERASREEMADKAAYQRVFHVAMRSGTCCVSDERGATVARIGDYLSSGCYPFDAKLAALFAASPRLLEELEDLVSLIDPSGPLGAHVQSAKKAIEDAKRWEIR